MRVELREVWPRGHAMTASAATAGASAKALNRAMSRSELLRALVRSHQHLVERRSQLTRSGAQPDPQAECDLAAITERITNLLSNREERPVFKRLMRPGIEHHIEEPLRET